MNTLEIERVCNGWLITQTDVGWGGYPRMHVATSRVQAAALFEAWLMLPCEIVPVGGVPE